MSHHDFTLHLSQKSTNDFGSFEGYASTFGNIDQGADRVMRGAFVQGLKQAKSDGRMIPMLWEHKSDTPIGVWDEIKEDAKGLFVKGTLLINDDPEAARRYAGLKAGAIGGLSIGYRVLPGGAAEDPKDPGVRVLTKVGLHEISLVTMPMDINAKITSVKTAELKRLRDRFAAGDRLTMREIETLFKSDEPLSLSNSEAERAVRINFKSGQGEPDKAVNEGNAFLQHLLA